VGQAPGTSALARCTAVDAATFAHEHWSRAPLLTRAKELPAGFGDLLSPDDVDELVADRALRTPFFRTVREGDGLPAPTRTVTAGSRRIADLVDAEALARQYADGATLVLNALHRMHPPVARFCRELAAELGHPTQCNAYLTPGGRHQGFDFHHDTHDVFVLQVRGRKRWVVHAPVLRLPLPSQPRSGPDLVADGAEPLLDVELEPGDALYLPRGFVHAAVTTDEDSVHLTVGVLATTWYDVLADALTLARDEEEFRGALPVQPRAQLPALLPEMLRTAAQWLEQLPAADVERVVAARLDRAVPPEPVSLLATAQVVRDLGRATPVRPRRGLPATVRVEGDRVALVVPGRTITLPVAAEPALRRMLAAPATSADLPGLDEEGRLVLVRRMLREGVVVPA
jgi:lysine-specific demethylase/histidyl-hydroxylase NO66